MRCCGVRTGWQAAGGSAASGLLAKDTALTSGSAGWTVPALVGGYGQRLH